MPGTQGFDDATFDFARSFNAIYDMIHEDRLSCLAEIKNVEAGRLVHVFNSQSRLPAFDKFPWQNRFDQTISNPVSTILPIYKQRE
jgi:hypothetical protein